MTKRPLIIVLISIIYLFSPFFILLQAAYVNRLPLIGYNSVFANLLIPDILVLVIYLLCAVSVYFVKKWGWYVFILCSLYLITYNIVAIILNPAYNILLLILYNLILTCITFVFFRKQIIAPFFNPRIRWWETEARYAFHDIYLEFIQSKLKPEIFDISQTGCFIEPSKTLEVGSSYTAVINCMQERSDIKIKVMRKAFKSGECCGYGLMFVDLNDSSRAALMRIIRKLSGLRLQNMLRDNSSRTAGQTVTAPRYSLTNAITLVTGESRCKCQTANISKSGCLIRTKEDLESGKVYDFLIECMNNSVQVPGKVVWKAPMEDQKGYGIKFTGMDRTSGKMLHRMIRIMKKSGALDRLSNALPLDDKALDGLVADTPYRLFLVIKKIIFGQR
ncbi:MAG: PilZ domain-containing protein [Spirochaetales bacterium]|nr:PilZ domain-containing protein [Spirochaetales bacterium]